MVKRQKKGLILVIIVALLFISSFSLVTADFKQAFTKSVKNFFVGNGNLITGFDTSRESNVSATIGNNAPVVEAVDGPGGNTISAQSITDDNTTELQVTFTVTDTNGVADINVGAANVTLYNTTYIATDVNYYSVDTTCDNTANISGSQMNFTCIVEINYWYPSGEWNLTAGVADYQNAASENATNFTIQETTAIIIGPTSLTFTSLTLGAENNTASNNPIVINNTGNYYVAQNNTRVAGLDLVGEVTSTEAIETANFTIGTDTGGSPTLECSNIGVNTTQLVNNTATSINETILSAGNRSVSGEGTDSLYACLIIVPNGLSAQTYSTVNSTVGWTISVV